MPNRTARLTRIYNRLRRGPVTIDTIKEWANHNGIDVSTRSLYRDLAEIERSMLVDGEQLIVTEGEKNKKTWKIEFNRSKRELSHFDITSFYLLKQFAPLSLVSARSNSLHKIESLFYNSQSKSNFEHQATLASNQITATHFYEFPYSDGYNTALQDCIWSIQNQRTLIIKTIAYDYTSISASIIFPLVFCPLQVLYHRGCIHLAGVTTEGICLILALEQITSYELSNDMFDASKIIPVLAAEQLKRFGITENINDQVYDIEIEFSEYSGSFVSNHHWHPTQQFSRLTNGNYLLQLRCGINRELVGWIFQWMTNAQVRKPLILKEMVIQKIANMSNLYHSDIPLSSNNSFKPQ